MQVLCLKLVLARRLINQSLRQEIICYNIIRECHCRQAQVREKKSEVMEERRANVRLKAGYCLVSRATVCLTSWISEALWLMCFKAILPGEWKEEKLSSTFCIPFVKVCPSAALSYNIRGPCLGPALYRVPHHLYPSLAAPLPTSWEVYGTWDTWPLRMHAYLLDHTPGLWKPGIVCPNRPQESVCTSKP